MFEATLLTGYNRLLTHYMFYTVWPLCYYMHFNLYILCLTCERKENKNDLKIIKIE